MGSDFEPEAPPSPASRAPLVCLLVAAGVVLLGCCGGGFGFWVLARRGEAELERTMAEMEAEAARQAEEARRLREGPPLDASLTLGAAGATADELTATSDVLGERLERAGIPGEVTVAGGKLQVDLPGDRVGEAMDLLLTGGDLQFKLLSDLSDEERAAEIARVQAAVEAGTYDPKADPYALAEWEESGEPVLLENPGVPGYMVVDVYPAEDDRGLGAIGFEMGHAGQEAFRRLTGENVGRDLGIVLDGVVKSAPEIASAIEGRGIVTDDDGFTAEEVDRLVAILGAGKLPVELSLESSE